MRSDDGGQSRPEGARRGGAPATDGQLQRGGRGTRAQARRGDLARTHEGEPGLPRGRSRLPTETVRAAQRERLLRAVIAAVASTGFASVTVADIVRRARVSRAAFYVHFSDKQDCFLAATRSGGQLMQDHIFAATRKAPPHASPERTLRAAITAFLEFLAAEPAFARAFYLDMSVAGPPAMSRFVAAQLRFAEMNRIWHERARARRPDWPAVPDEAYFALVGATTELVRAEVRQGKIESVKNLADTLVGLHLAVLSGRPWLRAGSYDHRPCTRH